MSSIYKPRRAALGAREGRDRRMEDFNDPVTELNLSKNCSSVGVCVHENRLNLSIGAFIVCIQFEQHFLLMLTVSPRSS